MAKKLKGDYFYLSANDLITGDVIYLGKEWSKDFDEAIKINRSEIDTYKKIALDDEKKCLVISPIFVELKDDGNIKKLRDKIRKDGITFNKK